MLASALIRSRAIVTRCRALASSAAPHEAASSREDHGGQTQVERRTGEVIERARAHGRYEREFSMWCLIQWPFIKNVLTLLCHARTTTFLSQSTNPTCGTPRHPHRLSYATSSGGDAKRLSVGRARNMVITMSNPRVKPLYKVTQWSCWGPGGLGRATTDKRCALVCFQKTAQFNLEAALDSALPSGPHSMVRYV